MQLVQRKWTVFISFLLIRRYKRDMPEAPVRRAAAVKRSAAYGSRGFTPGGAPAQSNRVRYPRGEFARCVLPTPLLIESVIFAFSATTALCRADATGPCNLMKLWTVKLLTRKTAVSRIAPVRDLISFLIPPGSLALFVVCAGLAASRFAAT